MKKEKLIIENECTIYIGDNPKLLLIQPVDDHDLEVLDSEVSCIEDYLKTQIIDEDYNFSSDTIYYNHINKLSSDFILAVFKVNDWNNDLTAWEADAVFGNQPFGKGAGETLKYIEDRLIPELIGRYGLAADTGIILGGYSLAGFFSLWASYQTDRFCGIAAASPSVWYPGWREFAEEHNPKACCIYLSLGDKEEKTKNKVMSAVGDNIRRQYELLSASESSVISKLEWNNGNHFKEPDIRTAKGFIWCIEHI